MRKIRMGMVGGGRGAFIGFERLPIFLRKKNIRPIVLKSLIEAKEKLSKNV